MRYYKSFHNICVRYKELMIPGMLKCLPPKKENTIILKFPLCPPHTEITACWKFHHCSSFLCFSVESFTTYVYIHKQTHRWASYTLSNTLCVCLQLPFVPLILTLLRSSVRVHVAVICSFPCCAFHFVGGGCTTIDLSILLVVDI